jgi:hypothetical protein
MREQDIAGHIENTFKSNPKTPFLYVTSDGQCFFPHSKNEAYWHSSSLADKRIAKITRADIENFDPDTELEAGLQKLAEESEKEGNVDPDRELETLGEKPGAELENFDLDTKLEAGKEKLAEENEKEENARTTQRKRDGIQSPKK